MTKIQLLAQLALTRVFIPSNVDFIMKIIELIKPLAESEHFTIDKADIKNEVQYKELQLLRKSKEN